MLLGTVAVLLQLGAVPVGDAGLQRDARAAQERFEGVRRAHLPFNRSGGSPRHCDATIGRYCYWYDSTETAAVPEPRRIAVARSELLGFLDSAATLDPADPWVAGQRVRYLIEAGRRADAVRAAMSCRAARWWCAALEGLALHTGEQYPDADSVFAVALREMPAPQRCEWLDLQKVVEQQLAIELSHARCEERALLADRLWRLSQPLWSVPGNDLRTEHFARLTMAEILARSANAHGMRWSSDSRELLLRYGWSEWFTRQDQTSGMYASPAVTGHDREPSYFFYPDVASIRSPPRVTEASWKLHAPVPPTRYAPRHIERMSALPHQLARFPRGDSMLVAIAYRVDDTALVHDALRARLAVLRHDGVTIAAAREHGTTLTTRLRDTAIASIEVRGERTKRVARARYTIDPLPCGSWCVSDLLLFTPTADSSPRSVEQALPSAATDFSFSNRQPLGVFWEIQGASPASVWISVTVSPLRVSLARRIAARLNLAPELAPVRMRWQATLTSPLGGGQHVTLRLPLTARGRYRVLLTVEPPSGPPLIASRDIELTR